MTHQGLCSTEFDAESQLFLKAAQNLAERQLTLAGYYRFGDSHILPKDDSPSLTCKVVVRWNGSSLFLQTLVGQAYLRHVRLRDVSARGPKEAGCETFLCDKIRPVRKISAVPFSGYYYDYYCSLHQPPGSEIDCAEDTTSVFVCEAACLG